jgi:hypothetical protein
VYAVDTRSVIIKVLCPDDRLTDVAEVLRLKMKAIDGKFSTSLLQILYATLLDIH